MARRRRCCRVSFRLAPGPYPPADCTMAAHVRNYERAQAVWRRTLPRPGGRIGAPFVPDVLACSPPNQSQKTRRPPQRRAGSDVFQVNLDTFQGPVEIEVAPRVGARGADHFYSLVKTGFYDSNRFFRVGAQFVVQFGISGDPQLNQLWPNASLPTTREAEHVKAR